MLAPPVAIEVLVFSSVKASQSLNLVLHGVRVHDVHNHGNACLMGIVDEVLQFLGCAEAAAGGIETRHMIAK